MHPPFLLASPIKGHCSSSLLSLRHPFRKGVCKPVYHHPISQSRKHRPIRSSCVPEHYLREEYSTAPHPPQHNGGSTDLKANLGNFSLFLPRGQAVRTKSSLTRVCKGAGTSCEKQSGDAVWRLKYVTFWDISIVYRASGTTHMKSELSQKIQDKW